MSAHVSATGWWTVGPSCSTTSLSVHSTRQLTPELSPSGKHETSWDAPNITRLKDPPANIANCIVESLSWWTWPLLDGMKFRAYSRLHKAPLHLDITWHNMTIHDITKSRKSIWFKSKRCCFAVSALGGKCWAMGSDNIWLHIWHHFAQRSFRNIHGTLGKWRERAVQDPTTEALLNFAKSCDGN